MKKIENFYDLMAQSYDSATADRLWEAPLAAKRLISDFKLARPRLSVLDLAAGTGQTIKPFVGKGSRIVAVDISKKMLKLSREKFPEIKTIRHDLDNGLRGLTLKPRSLDVVLAVGVLEFIKNYGRIIRESHRLLKPGGHLIFSYEPLLPESRFQKASSQYNADGYVDKPSSVSKFKLYRRNRTEVDGLVRAAGFKVLRHFKFKAFMKGPKEIPVYYSMVLVRK